MAGGVNQSFLERTLDHLSYLWREVTESKSALKELNLSADLNSADERLLKNWISCCLTEQGSEVAARVRAATLGRSYLGLSTLGQQRFLLILARYFDTDNDQVEQQITEWREALPADKAEAALKLMGALEPPRMTLLKMFNELPQGIKFLVDMRALLLSLRDQYPELRPLEADLKRLLTSWFDIGLLQLEQINWQSSAELLEKLIAYEAVHAIKSWDDLKNRLDSDRRCFAFFHPNMPNEPLIFVEVALVKGLADNVQTLLDEDAPVQDLAESDTAIFYSISNAQRGLAGISFGNFLIKRVVKELQQEFPQLKQFSTLSPMPGFIRWLKQLKKDELEELPGGRLLSKRQQIESFSLAELQSTSLKDALAQLAAVYLVRAERTSAVAADPVTHFHLSNGARIAQLNELADSSENGIKQSAGFMVNYLYDLPKIEERSQAYISRGLRSISPSIRALLNEP